MFLKFRWDPVRISKMFIFLIRIKLIHILQTDTNITFFFLFKFSKQYLCDG